MMATLAVAGGTAEAEPTGRTDGEAASTSTLARGLVSAATSALTDGASPAGRLILTWPETAARRRLGRVSSEARAGPARHPEAGVGGARPDSGAVAARAGLAAAATEQSGQHHAISAEAYLRGGRGADPHRRTGRCLVGAGGAGAEGQQAPSERGHADRALGP
jgi:hypothetical protein